MYKPSPNSRQASLSWDLETMLDPKNPLFKLANMVDWSCFEKAFAPLYCADNGRTPKPIRLMAGLLMLKHLRNVSDEQVVAPFTENAYYQYFCGLESFGISAPCASSELVHFRHCIGEEGIELIPMSFHPKSASVFLLHEQTNHRTTSHRRASEVRLRLIFSPKLTGV